MEKVNSEGHHQHLNALNTGHFLWKTEAEIAEIDDSSR